MYLYTVRLDSYPNNENRTYFILRLINTKWLPLQYPEFEKYDPKPDDFQLAKRNHFNLRLNSRQNEANVEIVWPLYGPQKIQLELLSSGYRFGKFIRQKSILILFVGEFDKF